MRSDNAEPDTSETENMWTDTMRFDNTEPDQDKQSEDFGVPQIKAKKVRTLESTKSRQN